MKIRRLLAVILSAVLFQILSAAEADTLLQKRSVVWRVGMEAVPAFVPGTNSFIRGNNPLQAKMQSNLSGIFRVGFNFDENTREGQLYKGLYQGIGIGATSFFKQDLTHTPILVHVYQGAPIKHFSERLWLGYEWKFGAAMGWKHYDANANPNAPVSTAVTAHMALGIRLNYRLSDNWLVTLGIEGSHYSNGNTSIPNSGINTIGAVAGVTYIIDTRGNKKQPIADQVTIQPEWFYDIMAYGAWRKRVLTVGEQMPQLVPGHFGVAGLQFSPMRRLNRWVAAGGALDMQYDEGAGLSPYWIEGSYDKNIKFHRPPFIKQLGIGVSAHAELIMPIFAINAGLGVNVLNPKGDKRFYQSLTLKTFVMRNVYLNVGYRLGNFKDPQNLMLGVGVRL